MNWFKNIIAAKMIIVFLLSFVSFGSNHMFDCDESSTSTISCVNEYDYVSANALLVAAKETTAGETSVPVPNTHFHCSHSVCCALIDTAATFASLLGVGKAFFNSTSNLIGVDLSAIHRPPSA